MYFYISKETNVTVKQEIPDVFITHENPPPYNPHPKKPKEELPQSQSRTLTFLHAS